MKVAFRVDASNLIGTGHVIRSVTLAERMRLHEIECLFICRNHPGNLISYIRKKNFEVYVLPMEEIPSDKESNIFKRDWLGSDWEVDSEQTKKILEMANVDILIVDQYALDILWEESLNDYCNKLIVVDDLANRKHSCDMLIDQNLVHDMDKRYQDLVNDNCILLLGPKFALLQSNYEKFRKHFLPKKKIKKILIYFGGLDSKRLTERSLMAFLCLNYFHIELNIVISSNNPRKTFINNLIKSHDNINLSMDLPSLAELMSEVDFSIGAGGATTWERLCLGLPSLVITSAKNQEEIARELDKRELIWWMGSDNSVSMQDICNLLEKIIKDNTIMERSKRCFEIVDGLGTERIINILNTKS